MESETTVFVSLLAKIPDSGNATENKLGLLALFLNVTEEEIINDAVVTKFPVNKWQVKMFYKNRRQ